MVIQFRFSTNSPELFGTQPGHFCAMVRYYLFQSLNLEFEIIYLGTMYLRILALSVIVSLFTLASTHAQWNAIAGYDISNADAGTVNQILHAFNDKFEHTKPFTDIRVLHGFTAGVRYQYRLGAFELVYNRRFTRRIGDQFTIDPLKNNTNADFYYEIRTFSLASEFGNTIT
ncbi:MAG: hypothetical protein HKN76_11055, partial [Saprospiraceae bacterium]|nr:hypothetical protein [Saprospiraceae bacterium]